MRTSRSNTLPVAQSGRASERGYRLGDRPSLASTVRSMSRRARYRPFGTVSTWPAAPVRGPRRQLTLASSGCCNGSQLPGAPLYSHSRPSAVARGRASNGRKRLKSGAQLSEQLARNQSLTRERQSCKHGSENRVSPRHVGQHCGTTVMGRPATLLRPGLIGMSQPKLRPTTHPINAPFGGRVEPPRDLRRLLRLRMEP